jgi:hypothetical protein
MKGDTNDSSSSSLPSFMVLRIEPRAAYMLGEDTDN